jgi:hypothetical protein
MGILAIWNDCARGTDAEFEHWFQSEHLAERLAVPGFRLGRRHEARLGDDDGVAGAEVWIDAEAGRPAPSAEEALRGGDARIGGCLCVQTLRLEDARRVRSVLAAGVGEPREIGIYRFLCERRPAGD